MVVKKHKKIYVFNVLNTVFLILLSSVFIYPLLYVFNMSISSLDAVKTFKVSLYPIGFSIESYQMVLNSKDILSYFFNSVFYAVVGAVTHVCFTMLAAYPLIFERFCLRKFINVFILVTMFFSGGLIPFFIVIRTLGLYNTRWAIILPALTGAWSIILARIYIKDSLGMELIESARLEGAGDFRILTQIVMPLSMPIIAYLALTSAVGHWNSYFNALIFLPDVKKQPIQVFLMRTIIQNTAELSLPAGPEQLQMQDYITQIKYAIIMIATVPILCIYPFLQKHFVKGIMVGALK